MSAQRAVAAWLKADPPLAGLLAGRIFSRAVLQEVDRPAVVISRLSGNVSHSLDGPSGMQHERLALTVVARNEADAQAVAAAIRGSETNPRLDGYYGTIGGERVTECTLEDQTDDWEPPQDASERGFFKVTQTYLVSTTD